MGRQKDVGRKLFDPAILSGTGQGTVSSGTPTLVSQSTYPVYYGVVSFEIVVTSTLAGTLTVEYANASDQDIAQGTDQWDTYNPTGLSIPAVTGAMVFGIGLPGFEFGRIRLKFVTSSGTGTITALLCSKGM